LPQTEIVKPENANLPIGAAKTANREIGVPGPQIALAARRLYNPATI